MTAVAGIQLPGERTDLVCPECGASMRLRGSKYGPFYSCSSWSMTGCPGSHGAHPDGAPLGEPATVEVKQARIRAHAAFDPMWKGKGARLRSRKAAYAWMREAMGLTSEQGHIGKFTVVQCDALIAHVDAFMETLR